ncbi:MAG: hypothetical protein RL110_1065 [Bacteroidota bacterium]
MLPAFFLYFKVVKEDLLQWAWAKKLLQGVDSISRLPIEIQKTGAWNVSRPGPDFTGAVIKTGKITWFGDVEVHLKSSDWIRHKHHLDPRYTSVILHVVLEDDAPLIIHGEAIPSLIVDPITVKVLLKLKQQPQKELPCIRIKLPFDGLQLKWFWEQRMARKIQSSSIELHIAEYLMNKTDGLFLEKGTKRQRDWQKLKKSLLTAKAMVQVRNLSSDAYQQLQQYQSLMTEANLTKFERQLILLNGIIPLIWQRTKNEEVIRFCKNMEAERYAKLKDYQKMGNKIENAFESQAILEINRQLCLQQKCLTCTKAKNLFNS